MKYKNLISKMSLREKASLCVGADYWSTKAIEELNIPSIRMSDGPNGLRLQHDKADNLGINESEVSTCFPSLSTLANSWSKEISHEYGKTIGNEAKCAGVDIVLGPGVNIKRSPLCGRNFEYFSEDPCLTGILGIYYVTGLQENNVGACIKHFAVNNQENRRRTIDAIIDDRTLNEIYLKAFELIVKNAKPWAIMSAYNKVNGTYCSENKKIINIAKKQWNFEGIFITDWGAINDRVKALLAGLELEMPGGRGNGIDAIVKAVETGKIKEEYLDEIIDNILKIALKVNEKEEKQKYNKEEHHRTALKIAEESVVLLKNDESVLPLKHNKIAIIGDMAKNTRYQGAGSSTVNPYKLENLLTVFEEEKFNITYSKGYERINSKEDEILREKAVSIAKENEIVIICAGLTENYESEGMDRTTLNLPENQNQLINEICKVNKNVIVVLSNGSVISMPWKDKVKAIITGYLGGEAGARAMVNCLIGRVNPSGKLAETYPLKLQDVPCYNYFPGSELTVEYRESIYVGYRHYNTTNTKVAFPFGYGLSYTNFEYSNLITEIVNDVIIINFEIKNVGPVSGKEIAQVYISKENSEVFRPRMELKEFEKVKIEPGKFKKITIKLSKSDLAIYNSKEQKWEVEAGKYKILIGKSVENIVLEGEVYIKSNDIITHCNYPTIYKTGNIKNVTDKDFEIILGHKIPERHLNIDDITEDNTIEQIKNTKVGAFIYNNEVEKMNRLLEEQNVNKATKVMMDMQKPLKKFYEKKSSNYTKKMIDELIKIAKTNSDYGDCMFVKEYLKKV